MMPRPYANLPFRQYAIVMGFIAGTGTFVILNICLVFFTNLFVSFGMIQGGTMMLLLVQIFFLEQSYFIAVDQFHSTFGTDQKIEWDCLKEDTPVEDVESIFFSAASTLIEKCYSKEELIEMINTQY